MKHSRSLLLNVVAGTKKIKATHFLIRPSPKSSLQTQKLTHFSYKTFRTSQVAYANKDLYSK